MTIDHISREMLIEVIQIQTQVVQIGIDLAKIMDFVTAASQRITKSDGASIELIENDELVYSSAVGMAEKFLGLRLPIANSLSGLCMEARTALISHDTETDPQVNRNATRQIGLRAMIVVPLVYNNHAVGVLKVMSKRAHVYTHMDQDVLELMSNLIAAAVFNAIQNDESELFYKAMHDGLTGIGNRSAYYDRLRKKLLDSIQNRTAFSIAILDMDGLKYINDTFGHRAGDSAIKEVANRIQMVLTEKDFLARLGGDEFGIILAERESPQALENLLQQIDEKVMESFSFEDTPLKLRVSIGCARFSEDGIDLDILIDKADREMYHMKRMRKVATKPNNFEQEQTGSVK